MGIYRYTTWDGRQDFPDLDKDRLLTELERNLTAYGDLTTALWKMQREGIEDSEGRHLAGNRELYQRLEQKKQELQNRFDFSSVTRAIRRQLEKIIDKEQLTDLPEDIDRQLEMLKQHRFSNTDARRELERLLSALQNNSFESLGGSGNKPTDMGMEKGAESQNNKEQLTPNDALKLPVLLQRMDRLEAQLKQNQRRHSLDGLDPNLVGEVLGEEALAGMERLRCLDSLLLNAGYIRETDKGHELTPRAIRRIGQKALEEIYAQLRRDSAGNHNLNRSSVGGMRLEETKKYEFGDDFNLHLLNTVMNSLLREPQHPPLTLTPADFETVKTEPMTRAATVLLLDLSRSMPRHGNFQSAKRVALALTELIRTSFPTDSLYVVGFSTYARQIAPDDLPTMGWDNRDRHTNIQHGLWLARRLLAREASANKHIILITDGEPTAHIENGAVFSQYPPTQHTRQMTLAEVRNCTEDGITINAFIFEGADFTEEFINGLAKINRGRVFFTSAQTLGRYLLTDFIAHKSKVIRE
ncbi:MAG TPA: VWA domain-containing protein [Dehalococcoidales bacterium]